MKIAQIYTECMAHAAYYIENNGEAAIFDPLREVDPYMRRAEKDGANIKYVFETHFHADFVSGHLELQQKTSAEIVFGPGAKPDYEATIAKDGQIFEIGNYKIQAIHTPGHTMESTTYLLIDEKGEEHGLITGDTLFIGDVGRPDLAQASIPGLTQELLAGHLYDSLRNKLMPLSDDLIIYPNHGAGSACGKNMSKETTSTLGEQKRTNYALRANMTKEEFIDEVLDGLTSPPKYFAKNVLMNIRGYDSSELINKRANNALTPDEFETLAKEKKALILDTRNADNFAKGFIPNSLNIGLNGSFAPWVGSLIADIQQPTILVSEEGTVEEALTRLSRVGFEGTIGFLKGSFNAWKELGKDYQTSDRINTEELLNIYKKEESYLLDIRKESEFSAGHIQGAVNIPLRNLEDRINEIPRNEQFIMYCAGGYRSMIATSILKKHGFNNFADFKGGFRALSDVNIPKSEKVCLSTLL